MSALPLESRVLVDRGHAHGSYTNARARDPISSVDFEVAAVNSPFLHPHRVMHPHTSMSLAHGRYETAGSGTLAQQPTGTRGASHRLHFDRLPWRVSCFVLRSCCRPPAAARAHVGWPGGVGFPKTNWKSVKRERVSPPLMKALRSRPGGGITLSRGTAAQRPKEPRLDATARPIAMLGFGVDGQRYALVCGSG